MVSPNNHPEFQHALQAFLKERQRIILLHNVRYSLQAVAGVALLMAAYLSGGHHQVWPVLLLVLGAGLLYLPVRGLLIYTKPLDDDPALNSRIEQLFRKSHVVDHLVAYLKTQTLNDHEYAYPLGHYTFMREEHSDFRITPITLSTYWVSPQGTVVEVICCWSSFMKPATLATKMVRDKKGKQMLAQHPELYQKLFGLPKTVL